MGSPRETWGWELLKLEKFRVGGGMRRTERSHWYRESLEASLCFGMLICTHQCMMFNVDTKSEKPAWLQGSHLKYFLTFVKRRKIGRSDVSKTANHAALKHYFSEICSLGKLQNIWVRL